VPRILNVKTYSLNAKVAISLALLALLLITILFALIVPKIEKDKYNTKIKEIEQVLLITEEQIKLTGKALMMQTKLETQSNQILLEHELTKLKHKIKSTTTIEEIKKLIDSSQVNNFCNYAIKYQNELIVSNKANIYKKYKVQKYSTWEELSTKKISKKEHVYNIKYSFYSMKVFNDLRITLFYEHGRLNKEHFIFEDTLKENIQNTFNLTQDLHKGKTYVFWLNSKYKNEDDKPLYEKDFKKSEDKYTISKISNVANIHTGDLTAKQIMKARNKEYIEHTLNGEKAISWIRSLYENESDNYIYLFVKTIYKKDLAKGIDLTFLNILSPAIISLTLALLLGFFIFKRLFKSINILTNTAREVNSGNTKIRSNVFGNDDIGILGKSFDLMLDSFESNIKNLDLVVKEKTKELQTSLEEKDTLLKEIHHRVKNNLALTISLIRLQQEEIQEEKVKKTLIDIQERIYTMELLHRKLYESPNLNQIDFNEYIKNLIENISSTHKDHKDLQIDIQIGNIFLNIEKAMPCGLILNELLTNAFKYAFQDNEKPSLKINLTKKDNKYILIVKDNGSGISDDIDVYNSNTLGLKLINSISVLQLKGEIDYTYDDGAKFKITFKF